MIRYGNENASRFRHTSHADIHSWSHNGFVYLQFEAPLTEREKLIEFLINKHGDISIRGWSSIEEVVMTLKHIPWPDEVIDKYIDVLKLEAIEQKLDKR
jgi:hypothetical protein